jgi:LPXTG-site transpeptidase (sortase) family protein
VTRPQAHYELHLAPALAPHEAIKQAKQKAAHAEPAQKVQETKKNILGGRVWRILEWLATSILIFTVLFFIINFSAYYELLKLKLDLLRGEYGLSPYIEQMMQTEQNAGNVTQQLLPQTATIDESKKQIPAIVLEIAPPDDRIIIPRIRKNVPIVKVKTENLLKRDWSGLEKDIQEALQNGVVHYPGTAEPGESGNIVITGHSSYFLWDPGRFKDVFALLHEVVVGDIVVVYHNQQKYSYQVYETKVVMPDQIEILTQAGGNRLTLITCTPVGTNLKRLVVLAKPL